MKQPKQPDIGTQLCVAAFEADVERAKQLLAQGADVNSIPHRSPAFVAGKTPLWASVSNAGMIDSTLWKEFINDLGQILPRVANRDDVAKRKRHFEMVDLLIGAGANLEALSHGTTPLWPAVHAKDLEMTKLLLAREANPNARYFSILSLFAKTERVKGPLGMMGYCGTALHGAARQSTPPIVEALLAAGADPSLDNDEGKTPLDIAVEKGFDEIAAILKRAQSGAPSTLK
jgi:ankyrin repeat protein